MNSLNTVKSEAKIDWYGAIPFFLLHVAVIGVFFVPFSWGLVALCVGMYYLRMFGITAGYHRYFSHRTYKMGRVAQFVMALIGTLSIQKGVLWWAAHHRHHHQYSDKPQDLHSPKDGFWWSHVGWILADNTKETNWKNIRDLSKYPELRWLDRHYLIPPVLLGVAMYFLGGPAVFFWGFVLSTVLLWHGTFTINSLSHVFGSQRYASNDTSRNNWFLAIVTMGEGWHNNHHAYMASTRQGFFWWEYDFSYYILKALSWIGVVSDLREPPLEKLEARRIDRVAAATPIRPAHAGRAAADVTASGTPAQAAAAGPNVPLRDYSGRTSVSDTSVSRPPMSAAASE